MQTKRKPGGNGRSVSFLTWLIKGVLIWRQIKVRKIKMQLANMKA
jgi:hypothetical protein